MLSYLPGNAPPGDRWDNCGFHRAGHVVKLSVIMPVYNRERYVVPALRSLLRQRDAANLDIIAIDDGSTDGSAAAVRSMMDGNPCIRLFRQPNMGVAGARNAG